MMTREEFLVEQAAGNFNPRLTYERYVELQEAKALRAARELNALPVHTRKTLRAFGYGSAQSHPSRTRTKSGRKAA